MGFSGDRCLELRMLGFQSWFLPADPTGKQGASGSDFCLEIMNGVGVSPSRFMKVLYPQILDSHSPDGGSVLSFLPFSAKQLLPTG